MRILIVEDSLLIQSMYRLVFPREQHEVVTACGGREALGLLEGGSPRFDLILLDLRMPDMDGVDFLREARLRKTIGATPVVLTTIEPDGSELLEQAVALGVAAVVKKPWKPQQLRRVLEGILR